METKKSKKADIEGKRPMFLNIGLVISLSLALLAFEWKTPVQEATNLGTVQFDSPDYEIVLPIPEQPKIPDPKPMVVDLFVLVEDEFNGDDIPDIFDTEINKGEAVNIPESIKKPEETPIEEPAVWIAEEMPEFPGGMTNLLKFISSEVNYPVIAQETGIQGKVIVTFVIDKTGQVTEVKIFRGIDPSLDAEALRVVRSMPKWKPGRQGGVPVKVNYNVPINFVLQ